MRRLLNRTLTVTAALLGVASVAAAQGGTTISGRVTSDAGAPLPGANVYLVGLNIGTQTNDAGRYTFIVPAARATGQTATLTARVIGYTARTVSVTLTPGGTITQNFALPVNPLRLGEVVVTGAGTSTTRERLTTTINTVDSAALRRSIQPQNVVSALAAQAPNVEVRTQSGEPGASASIHIRGISSLSGTNQPLFVVDGVPIANQTISTTGGDASTVTENRAADINPADIANIEILKGGAAAAIYGAQAANGVILITTKRGHAGPTRYTLSSTEAWDHVYMPSVLQTGYAQGVNGKSSVCGGPNCVMTALSWGAPLAPGTPIYDHQTELFDTGLTADNNLQVSGGNDRTTFFASGGLTNQNGYLKGPNNKYNRLSIRLEGTQQVSSKLNIGGNLTYIDGRGRFVQKGSNISGVMLGALRTPPNYNDENTYTPQGLQRPYRFPNPTTIAQLNGHFHYDNPFFVLNNPGNRQELGRSISSVNANWNPFGWLNVKENLGADYYNDWRLQSLPLTSGGDTQGNVTRLDINNLGIDHNLIATAQHSFGDNFDATVTLGQNLNSRRYRQINTFGEQLIAPTPLATQNTVTQTTAEFRSLRHIEAYFGQAEVNLFKQLVVNVGIRNDGFSTFGASQRRHNFPKASAAWTFSNLFNGGDRSGIFSYGKLHIAYGETGKEPPVYGAVTALTSQAVFGSGYGDFINSTIAGQGGLATSGNIGNPALRPERNRETEYGGDFAFFNSKVDLSATYYDKRSSDVIIAVPVNASANGAGTKVENAASLTNKGLEVTLNLHPIQRENASWDIGVQYGRNKGNVTSLAGATFIPYNNEGFTGAIGSSTVGYAPGVIRGSDFIRCGSGATLPDGTNVNTACGSAPKGALYIVPDTMFNNDGSVASIRGRPIPNPADQVIADPNPKYTMSFSTSLRLWNKITFSGLLDVRKGGSVWDGTRGVMNYFGVGKDTYVRNQTNLVFGKNFLTDVYPVVTGPGKGLPVSNNYLDWQDWYTGNGGGFGPVGAQFIEDGSFVKLRELSATYTMDMPWVRHLTGFSSADIRIAGRNLKTWTKYKGFDPEANLGGAEFLTQGLDYFMNPQTRSFVLSVSLNR